jgi:hypothetical protein
VTADDLITTISGSGSLNVKQVTVKSLASSIFGSGKCVLASRVTDRSLVVNGSGKYAASHLESQTMSMTVRGSGSSTIKATQALDVTITGSRNLNY